MTVGIAAPSVSGVTDDVNKQAIGIETSVEVE
jgi:hypothetical protein